MNKKNAKSPDVSQYNNENKNSIIVMPSLNKEEVVNLMQECGVDPVGVSIMSDKFYSFCVKINNIDSVFANVIKQEMLALGSDAANNKYVINHKVEKSSMLLYGSIAHYKRLIAKLKKQNWTELKQIGEDLSKKVDLFLNKNLKWKCNDFILDLSKKTYIMGVLNVTSDSFYDGGKFLNQSKAVEHALEMIFAGADIIDIGCVSSHVFLGDNTVSEEEEIARMLPILKLLKKETKVPISIDTFREKTIQAAIDNGCDIINNVFATVNEKYDSSRSRIDKIIAKSEVGYIVCHAQKDAEYRDVVADICFSLGNKVNELIDLGVNRERICLDPNIGLPYGKTQAQQLEIIRNLEVFTSMGMPTLLGLSRKSILTSITGNSASKNLYESIGAAVFCASKGINVVRVHDVSETSLAVKISDCFSGLTGLQNKDYHPSYLSDIEIKKN